MVNFLGKFHSEINRCSLGTVWSEKLDQPKVRSAILAIWSFQIKFVVERPQAQAPLK